MTDFVALLRAVNVGGTGRLPMAELREALRADGLENVTTILQSGNVLFSSGESEDSASARIGAVIESAFDMKVDVMTRSAAALAGVVAANPFLAGGAAKERDPKTLHVVFLSGKPSASAVSALEPDRSPPDAFAVEGREVYLRYPNGSGRSRLTLDYLERRLGVRGTSRNWRTVQRLADLTAG